MSGVAFVVDWSDPRSNPDLVGSMLDAMAHRAVDGRAIATAPHAAIGFAARATTARERTVRQPYHDASRTLWIVADVRIDNRSDVARALGIGVPASDVELLAAGYHAWGTRLAHQLVGDFAFVIWDERERAVYAARDVFGVRPLFFARDGTRLGIASEVDALRTMPGLMPRIDAQHLAEFASGTIRDATRTMFESIRRVPAGHALFARERRDELRAWYAFPTESPPRDARDDIVQFRERFLTAVNDRLEADGPVLSQLSGGIDSASIAAAIGTLVHSGRSRTDVTFASAIYPGMECDESSLVDAVIQRIRLPHVSWDAASPLPHENVLPIAAVPWRALQPQGADRAVTIARERGARVLLTGDGGDALLTEIGAFADHARRGRFMTLYRETIGSELYLVASGRDMFRSAIRRAAVGLIPPAIRVAYRALRPAVSAPPTWFGPTLRDGWNSGAAMAPTGLLPAPEGISSIARQTWNWLTSPTAQLFRDVDEAYAARAGIEVRLPYFDRRLAALVLSIPAGRRLAAGRIKRLIRDAFANELPPEVSQRTRVTTFEPSVVRHVVAGLDELERILGDPSGSVDRYIDRRTAVTLWERVRRAGREAEPADCYDLWSIASIELWLRTMEDEV